MSEGMGKLLKKISIVQKVIIVGAILGTSYLGYNAYDAYEKYQVKEDNVREERTITNNFEKTLEFVILKTQYQTQKDSLDKAYNRQDSLLKNTYFTKKDSLMQAYRENLKK